ncbi:MAG: DUF368 domain-containing protein [Clostridium sp.]|uniref:DUF368 domain-containing protein n=1 Tax=Clostridium sp. TaxID=1506 RepID=UPI0030684FBB
MENILNILKGVVIGVSNVIPGVSGGTMAVVLGIYDKIISAVNNFFKDWRKDIIFLIELAIGAVLGIVLFSKLITNLLQNYGEPTNFFFIGLILGSFPMLYKRATKDKVKSKNYIWLFITLALMIAISFFGKTEVTSISMVSITVKSFITLFFAGFIAAATMILPGVSGSLVLLILGLYTTLTNAVSTFNIPLLIPVGLGVIVGLLATTKLIESLLNKYPQPTYLAICGLILGSIFPVYPGFTFGLTGAISIGTFIIGFVLTYILGKKESA